MTHSDRGHRGSQTTARVQRAQASQASAGVVVGQGPNARPATQECRGRQLFAGVRPSSLSVIPSVSSASPSPILSPGVGRGWGTGRNQRLGPSQKHQIPLGRSCLTPRRCATRPGAFGGGGRLASAQPATTSNPCEAPQALRSQPRRSQRDQTSRMTHVNQCEAPQALSQGASLPAASKSGMTHPISFSVTSARKRLSKDG